MCNEKGLNIKKCHCGSGNVEDRGHRFGTGLSKNNWKNETWKCNDCGKTFIIKGK